jgi:hypothetical protein
VRSIEQRAYEAHWRDSFVATIDDTKLMTTSNRYVVVIAACRRAATI